MARCWVRSCCRSARGTSELRDQLLVPAPPSSALRVRPAAPSLEASAVTTAPSGPDPGPSPSPRAAAQRRPRAVLMPVLPGKSRPRPAGRMMKKRRGRERKATLPRGSRPDSGAAVAAAAPLGASRAGEAEGGGEGRSSARPRRPPEPPPPPRLYSRPSGGNAAPPAALGTRRALGVEVGLRGASLPPPSSAGVCFSGFQLPRGKTLSHRHRHSIWMCRRSPQLCSKVLPVLPKRNSKASPAHHLLEPRYSFTVWGTPGSLCTASCPDTHTKNLFPDALGRKKYL